MEAMKGRKAEKFYQLSSLVLGGRGVRFPIERYDELLTIFRDGGVFQAPFIGHIPKPYKEHHFVWSLPFPFVRRSICDLLFSAGISGFSINSVLLEDEGAPEALTTENYCFLSIHGRCDNLIPQKSSHLQIVSRQCPGGRRYCYRGIDSPPPGWSGHDMFLARDSHAIGVTERVRNLLRTHNAKGCRLVSLDLLTSLNALSLDELERMEDISFRFR